MKINSILFPDFETLDVFGAVEIFGKVDGWQLEYYSLDGGIITNGDNVRIGTLPLSEIKDNEDNTLFVPGGQGTRTEVNNNELLEQLRQLSDNSRYVLAVCTGSALLAKAGILDGRKATSNKRAFDWVKTTSAAVDWICEARWVADGKFYTSSGISAGMDMALGFVADRCGRETAVQIAHRIEYRWNEDKDANEF